MGSTKVSIIIPVYNASAYLRKCLDSVIGQTYKDIEIICIDDGSKDDSGVILDEYAKTDLRMRVIHKENGGLPSARNAGLKASKGDYIIFIDNDDYIELDYIQMLYQNIEDMDAVVCGFRSVQNGRELEHLCPKKHIYLTNQEIKDAYQNKKELYSLFGLPYAKMYKRCTIGENLQFDESLIAGGEDIVFNLYFWSQANSAKTIDYCGYNVRKRLDSITHQNALRYSAMSEHGYTYYYDAKTAAQLNWGFDSEKISAELEKSKPAQYFRQVMNLVSLGTPYNKKQINEKIREIHEDREFIQPILTRKYSDLSMKEKFVKLNVQINKPKLTGVMFRCINKIYSFLIRSSCLRELVRKIRQRKKNTQ